MTYETFMESMDGISEISRYSNVRKDEIDPEKKKEAIARLYDLGFNYFTENHGEMVNVDTLTDEQKNQYSELGLRDKNNFLNHKAGKAFSDDLEGILDGINDGSLEDLASEENIRRAGDNRYNEILAKSDVYLGAKRLAEDYRAGSANPKDLQVISQSVGEGIAKEYEERLIEEGFDSDTIADAVETIKFIARDGAFKKEHIDRGMQLFVEKREQEFRNYENSSGLKIVDFVKDSIKKLRDNENPKDSGIARTLTYAVAKKVVSD